MAASIYSIEGRRLSDKHLGRLQEGVNRIEIGEMLEGLASGQYLFVIKTVNKTIASKVIK